MISKVYDIVGTRPSSLSRMTSPVRWAKPTKSVTVKDGKRVFNDAWKAPKVESYPRKPFKSLFA